MWNRDRASFRQHYYRTADEAFKDAHYACAIERDRLPLRWWAQTIISHALIVAFAVFVAWVAVEWWFQ